ncbi:aspartate aminotransferase family protein [Bacteroidota bacterium]
MMEDIIEKEKNFFLQTYNRIPLEISNGDGVHIITKDGTRYLDFFSGLGVNVLGHSHPSIVEAIHSQAEKYLHLSNYFITDVQLNFSEMLLKQSNMSKVFLTNSGAEAVEAAIKAVRKLKGRNKKIYSITNSFHGRTYGALSLTEKQKYKVDFEPMLQNVDYIDFNNIDDLQKKANEKAAAVFIEFLQGEGGINLVSEEFVYELEKLRSKYDFITVADCIQSGIGRTGKTFAFNHFNFYPDMIVAAKAIGGGLPLGALMVKKEFANLFHPGSHGSTFGGNPLSCAAGMVVLQEVFENGLIKNVEELGSYLKMQLIQLKDIFPQMIREVRGLGFMIGVEFRSDCKKVVEKLLERKVLSNCTNNNVLRLLPPFIATKSDIDFFLYNLHEILKEH